MHNCVQAYPVDDHITIINKQYENIKKLKSLLLLIGHPKLNNENKNKLIHLIHPYFDENRIQNSDIDQEFEEIVNQSIIQINE